MDPGRFLVMLPMLLLGLALVVMGAVSLRRARRPPTGGPVARENASVLAGGLIVVGLIVLAVSLVVGLTV